VYHSQLNKPTCGAKNVRERHGEANDAHLFPAGEAYERVSERDKGLVLRNMVFKFEQPAR
jgi:hypothetical protein